MRHAQPLLIVVGILLVAWQNARSCAASAGEQPLKQTGQKTVKDEPPKLDDDEIVIRWPNGKEVRVKKDSKDSFDLGDMRFQLVARKQGGPETPSSVQSAPAPVSPPAQAAQASKDTVGRWGMLGLVGAGVGLLVVGVGATILLLLIYIFVFEPMRRRWPLRQALVILHEDQQPRFAQAEELLQRSLLAGMRKGDIAQARFALGYVRARLGRFEEAGAVLTDLEKSGAALDQASAYLLLWVQSRLQNHERVERLYSDYRELLDDVADTRLIVSKACLALARLHWARREINSAMHYFNQVRDLEVLSSEIPAHIDSHEVVMGTVALFERNIDEACRHFQVAVAEAKANDKPAFPGRLGLLLCEWKRSQLPNLDKELSDVLLEMQPKSAADTVAKAPCPHCGKPNKTRKQEGQQHKCTSCKKRFVIELPEQADERGKVENDKKDGKESSVALNDDDVLLRNVRLWHCVTLLIAWLLREPKTGLPPAELKEFRKRLKAVSQIDPDMGDPYLLGGLITYYFAQSEEERSVGRAEIKTAVEKDVHVPEVLQLLDRENKLAALAANCLTYYHQMALQYVKNPEIDPQLRERFLLRMNRYRRFRDLGLIDAPQGADTVSPSLNDLQARGQILRNRLANIVRHRVEEQAGKEINDHISEFQECGEELTRNAKTFQQKENELIVSTGEFLFRDEEPADGKPPEKGKNKDGRTV